MGKVSELLHGKPTTGEITPFFSAMPRPSIPEHYVDLEEHAVIEPSEDAPQLIAEIDEMLDENEGLTDEQFVQFTDKMVNIVGGYHHALGEGKERIVRAEIGRKPGNAVEIARFMGDWTGPDVRVSKYKQINEELNSSHLLMLEEAVQVFSYDPEMPSTISRRIYSPFPSLSPEITSTTGEQIKPLNDIELKGKGNLTPEEFHAIATDVMEFYASTINSPDESGK